MFVFALIFLETYGKGSFDWVSVLVYLINFLYFESIYSQVNMFHMTNVTSSQQDVGSMFFVVCLQEHSTSKMLSY